MPNANIDDQMTFNKKIIRAGNEAVGAWVRMIALSNLHLTDGFIDDAQAQIIASPKLLERMASVGLLERETDGYRVHDFHDFSPRAEDVIAKRDAERKRKADYRATQKRGPDGRIKSARPDDRPAGVPRDVPAGVPPGQGAPVRRSSSSSSSSSFSDSSSPRPPTPETGDRDKVVDPQEKPRTAAQQAYVATLQASEDLRRDSPAPDWWRAAGQLEALGFSRSAPPRVQACLAHALAELEVARTQDPRTKGGWSFVHGRVVALLPSGALEAARTKFAQRPAKTSAKGEFDQQVYLDERKQRQQRAAGGSS
jgi:hypothetical protein